jgi:hypothetical protein
MKGLAVVGRRLVTAAATFVVRTASRCFLACLVDGLQYYCCCCLGCEHLQVSLDFLLSSLREKLLDVVVLRRWSREWLGVEKRLQESVEIAGA